MNIRVAWTDTLTEERGGWGGWEPGNAEREGDMIAVVARWSKPHGVVKVGDRLITIQLSRLRVIE